MTKPMIASALFLAGCASLPASPGMLQPEAKSLAGEPPVARKIDAAAKESAIKQGVEVLIRLQQGKDKAKAVEEAVEFYLDAIQQLEIPKSGGWNYARPPGRDTAGAPSTFMTSSALHALFEAAKAGYKVDPAVVARGLEFLDKARAA